MGLESLPLTIFLLLPGFLSWFVFCWGTVTRKISQFQHFFASLILSILIFTIDYYIVYLVKLATNTLATFPAYTQILTDPAVLPPELGVAVYLTAIWMGFLLIGIYKNKRVRELFWRFGLDLYRHEDVWYRTFRECDYITVYLKDGRIIAGWPTYYNQGGSENTELYLQNIHYYRKKEGQRGRWVKPSRSVEGLLLNTAMISYIELRRPEEEDKTAQRIAKSSAVFSRMDCLRMGMLIYSFGLILLSITPQISDFSFAGLALALLSLIFMFMAILEGLRNWINSLLGRIRKPILRNLPKFFEWYILVTVFTVQIIRDLLNRSLPNTALLIGLYVIGVTWLFVSIAQLIPERKRSSSDYEQ